MKRFFCLCISAFLLTTYLILTFGESLFDILTPIFIVLFVVFLVLWVISRKNILAVFALIFLFAIGALFKTTFIDLKKLENARCYDEEYVVDQGKVISFNRSSKYISFTVECSELNCRVKVISRNTDLDIDIGTIVGFSGVLEFDENCDKGDETFLSTYSSDVKVLSNKSAIVKIRNYVRNSTETSQNSTLINALLIGDRSGLNAEMQSDFQRLGTSHILAISGLHLSIVVMSFYVLLGTLGISRRKASLVCIAFSFFYMAIAGFTLSVVRAGQMTIIYLITKLIRRINDGITALFISGFVIVLSSAWSLFSLSFLLSFFATFGILVFLPNAVRWHDRKKCEWIETNGYPTKLIAIRFKIEQYLLVSLYSTLASTIFTLPVILISFNAVSLISPIANLLLVFFAKYILTFSCIGAVTFSIPIISTLFFALSDLSIGIMMMLTRFLTYLSGDPVGVDMGFIIWGVVIGIVFIIISAFFCRKIFALPITAVIMLFTFFLFNLTVSRITYDHIRISTLWRNGYNCAIVSSHGKNYLVDQTASSTSVSLLSNLMDKRRIDSIDEAFIVVNSQKAIDRVDALADIIDVEKITFLVDSEKELYFHEIDPKCLLENIEINQVYNDEYKINDNITFYRLPELYQGFTVEKSGYSMGFYKGLSKEDNVNLPQNNISFIDNISLLDKDDNVYLKGELPMSFWRITEKRIIRE